MKFKKLPCFKIKKAVATKNLLRFKIKNSPKSGFWCHFKVEIA